MNMNRERKVASLFHYVAAQNEFDFRRYSLV
jgi:hypothetical protein